MRDQIIKHLTSIPNVTMTQEQALRAVEDYLNLHFDATYAVHFSPEEIAMHAYGFTCGVASAAAGNSFYFSLERQTTAFYLHNAAHSHALNALRQAETFLERCSCVHAGAREKKSASIRSYHSQNAAMKPVVLLVAELLPFIDPTGESLDFNRLTTEKFLKLRPQKTVQRYREIMEKVRHSINFPSDSDEFPKRF